MATDALHVLLVTAGVTIVVLALMFAFAVTVAKKSQHSRREPRRRKGRYAVTYGSRGLRRRGAAASSS